MTRSMRVPQMQAGLLRLHGPSLEQKDAGDDLQAVGNAMLHLLQQRLLLLQQFRDRPFRGAPVGDIFDRQQNELVSIPLIEHLTGVQEHRASSDNGKIPLDFVSLHRGVSGPRHPPAAAEARGYPTGRRPARRSADRERPDGSPERLIESAICGDDAQVLIEDKQRIADRIHDRLGERARIIEVSDRAGCWATPRRLPCGGRSR